MNNIKLPFNDNYQNALEKDLENIYSNYNKNFNPNFINTINTNKNIHYQLIKYSIFNSNLIDIKFDKNTDDRCIHNFNMIKKNIKLV